ncbi:M15 family metallopeptidase [Patescibacteria group bacterium]|nr:M15 family metallopeptidase [Patescibacteria group bacterium]MBU1015776.1 M15 family metallopeptidase [Patescibacteria group bacterium]MBU1685184.1 M15 family metallopeptidase [Patescibacteria group bacterium]MBU1938320.1 M15 family metallopeptidase [Patescibacteria group bacterium]
MTNSPEKTEAAKTTAEGVSQGTQNKLKEAKDKVEIGKLFKDFWESLKSWDGTEALKRFGLIVAAISGKLRGLKEDVEKTRQNKKESDTTKTAEPMKAQDKAEDKEENSSTPANDNALPKGLDGMKWTKENLLKCDTIDQCRALMRTNGFVLDKGSGNYVNPRWLSPDKILQEPIVDGTIGGRRIRLKQSVMARLKRADTAMSKETGEHIKVGEHFRSNEHQFELYKKLKPMDARVAPPGTSFHEIGQAVDLPENWEKAQKFMWAEGFVGGKLPIGLSGDANHFSVGEMKMNAARVAALRQEGVEVYQKAA